MTTMESLTELNSMIACTWECTRQSRWKEQTQRYLANLLLNSVHLRDELLGGTYRVKPTKDFYLNEKKTHVIKLSHGFTWLQTHYTITRSGHIIKRPTRSKMVRERRRLKAFCRLYDRGLMTEQDVWRCYQSWRGSIVREYNAYRKSLARMDALYRSLFPEHKEQPKPLRSATVKSINRSATKEDLYYCLTV